MGFLGEANQRQNIIQQYCEMRHRSERDRERNIHIQISEHFLAKCQLNYQLHALRPFNFSIPLALSHLALCSSLQHFLCVPHQTEYICVMSHLMISSFSCHASQLVQSFLLSSGSLQKTYALPHSLVRSLFHSFEAFLPLFLPYVLFLIPCNPTVCIEAVMSTAIF